MTWTYYLTLALWLVRHKVLTWNVSWGVAFEMAVGDTARWGRPV